MTVGERRGLTPNRLESSRVCECDLEEEERVEIYLFPSVQSLIFLSLIPLAPPQTFRYIII
jgi:hypothetical protein